MERLFILYQDKATLEDFKAFYIATLEAETIKRVYKKEDVSGIADARKLLDDVFNKLDDLYKPKVSKKQVNHSK